MTQMNSAKKSEWIQIAPISACENRKNRAGKKSPAVFKGSFLG